MRSLMRCALTVGLAIFLLPVNESQADESTAARAGKILSFWKSWVKEAGADGSAIAISFKGKLVSKGEIGRKATDPYPVASLTKAITGICVAKLVEKGELTYATKLNEKVPSLNVSATIGELLSHTSGYTKDVTQSSLRWVKDRSKENLELVSNRQLAKDIRKSSAGYAYNNANYAMLGVAIKQITGKSYEEACHELVLKPLGIESATLNPPWRLMASWGGWKISAVDYLKFVDAHFSNKGVLGEKPTQLPHIAFNGGAHYGMGYLFRKGQRGGYHYWHTGAWDWRGKPKKESFSAFFAKWANGWAVSVNADVFPGWELIGKLDQGLWKASWQ